ncbi:Protein IN2-1 -like protein B, partial [Capsicum chinense]
MTHLLPTFLNSSVLYSHQNPLIICYKSFNFPFHLIINISPKIFVSFGSCNYSQSKSATLMATPSVQEIRPSSLLSTSEPPSLFDGTTRLYISYICPFAQRAWITRNVKGLQDKIELVPIDLQNRPAWYKEKVYPQNKVPALEHNNKVIGESLDLIKYIDSNFEGPSLLPDDPEKQKFAEELVAYTDTFLKEIYGSFKGDVEKQAGPQFDYLEKALEKFDNGPFFLGQFSQADIAYASFIERFQIFLQEVFNYDITSGRPKLAKWIEELNKIDGYIQTKADPKKVVEIYKSRFM